MRFVFLLLMFLACVMPAYARYNPTDVTNNKYGIHILDPLDLDDAAVLVNSSGGDWGYVTIVIQEDDRNFDKWQTVFDRMRRLHLIPIVRIATKIQGSSWTKPEEGTIDDWGRFLTKLNWPVENRYVILYNEPNHAKEWGNTLEPEEYGRFAEKFAKKLHEYSEDFFVMPAGLDVSAASDGHSMDAYMYMSRMFAAAPGLLSEIDGWSSHSYPNPAFSGSPYAIGRGTLLSYQWELSTLIGFGLKKALPVFITETGWVHSEGITTQSSLLRSEAVGNNLTQAASRIWQDDRIVAITPFVLSYQGAPFDHFSWKKIGGSAFYPHFYSYQAIPKKAGQPRQREEFIVLEKLIPESLVTGSSYTLRGTIKNTGQSILSHRDGYKLDVLFGAGVKVTPENVPTVEPNQSGELQVRLITPNKEASYPYTVSLRHREKTIELQKGSVKLLPPPSVALKVTLGWKTVSSAQDISVLVYDKNTLLHEFRGLDLKNGIVEAQELRGVIPGKIYRVVVLAPYYLPRQVIGTLTKDKTTLTVKRMYPLDLNKDGHLSIVDILILIKTHPAVVWSRLVGI